MVVVVVIGIGLLLLLAALALGMIQIPDGQLDIIANPGAYDWSVGDAQVADSAPVSPDFLMAQEYLEVYDWVLEPNQEVIMELRPSRNPEHHAEQEHGVSVIGIKMACNEDPHAMLINPSNGRRACVHLFDNEQCSKGDCAGVYVSEANGDPVTVFVNKAKGGDFSTRLKSCIDQLIRRGYQLVQ